MSVLDDVTKMAGEQIDRAVDWAKDKAGELIGKTGAAISAGISNALGGLLGAIGLSGAAAAVASAGEGLSAASMKGAEPTVAKAKEPSISGPSTQATLAFAEKSPEVQAIAKNSVELKSEHLNRFAAAEVLTSSPGYTPSVGIQQGRGASITI